MVQRGLATAVCETGGSASGQWVVGAGFFTPWVGTPTAFITTTGVGWVSQPWTSFRIFKDGNASTPLLRPHVNATDLRVVVWLQITGGGTFGTNARIELVDDAFAGKDWIPDLLTGVVERFDRVVYASAAIVPTSSLVAYTLTIPAETIRGWEASGTLPAGGIRNFGDIAVRIYAPGSPSNPGVTTLKAAIEVPLQDTEPYADRTADFGVRHLGGSNWASVHYASATQFTVREVGGGALNAGNIALADAITRAGNAGASYGVAVGDPVVVEIEALGSGPGAPHIGAVQIGGNDATTSNVALWKDASGAYRAIENLIIRSADRTDNGRAQIDADTSGITTVTGQTPTGWREPGHISFAGVRLYCTEHQVRCFSDSFDMWSNTLTLGMYGVDFTGEVTKAAGGSAHGGFEFTHGLRFGYHAFDFLDCRIGTAGEHWSYGAGAPSLPSQILRCANTKSTNFYPLNPDPDLTFNNGRLNFTLTQTVSRTNPCAGAGEGPAAYGTILHEDCTARNLGSGASAFTIVGHLGAYINRRCAPTNIETSNGGGIIMWGDTLTGAADNQPKGHHSSLGQHDGPDIGISCNALPVIPEPYPHTGTAYIHGNVVVEAFGGSGIADSSPIRINGAKSIKIRRGDFRGHPKLPTIHEFQLNSGTTSWGNSGPYQSLAFTLEHMGATPQSYKWWRASTSQIAFGGPNNPMGPQGGAGSNNHILLTAHVNALKSPSTAWPPWRQGIELKTETTVGGQTNYNVARVYPGMSPPATYGTKHTGGSGLSGSSIIFPGRNTFSGAAMRFTPTAMQVGGSPGGGTSRISGRGDVVFGGSAEISFNFLAPISGQGNAAFGGSAQIQGAVRATGSMSFGGSALIGAVATGTPNQNPMNVLLINIDDLGAALFDAASEQGVTPNLDRLRATGMQFTNFWAAPLCSLARARALTGLDAYRSGNLVGQNLNVASNFGGPTGAWITKDMPGERTMRGKWHMSQRATSPSEIVNPEPPHGALDGFHSYSGCQANLAIGAGTDYNSWQLGECEQGFPQTVEMSREFATNHTYKKALADVLAGVEFVSVAFNAIHEPLTTPPNNQPFGVMYPSGSGTDSEKRLDLLRHLDFRLACLCDRAIEEGYIVMVWFDNGTVDAGKGDMTEAGVRTRLLVFGPPGVVTQGTSTRLVQATDLWGVVRWLRGCTDHTSAVDSKNFVDAFLPNQAAIQAERQFLTVDDGPFLGVAPNPATWRRGIRDARWKLIDDPSGSPVRYFFDLLNDPDEATNLYPSIPAGEATTAYNLLVANLQTL